MQISTLADITAFTPREKPIFTPEQMAGHELSWARDLVDNNPYLLINPVTGADGSSTLAGPVGYIKQPDVPPALAGLIQITAADMMDVTGGDLAAGEVVANTSDALVSRVQAHQDMQVYIFTDGMKRAMQRCGEIYLSMACDIYTEENRKFSALNEDEKTYTTVTINVPSLNKKGEPIITKCFTRGMDVFVDVGPAFNSRKDATVNSLTKVLPMITDPTTQQLTVMTIVKNLDGEGMDDLANYAHKQLVKAGVVEPTDEEKQEMEEEQAAAANAPPDAATVALLAQARESDANATKSQASAVQSLSTAELNQAKAAQAVSQTNSAQLATIIQMLQGMQGNVQGTAEQISAAQPQHPLDGKGRRSRNSRWTCSCRRSGKETSEIWFSMNPELDTDPVYTTFIQKRPANARIIEVNWDRNPFWNAAMEAERLRSKADDPDDYDHIWEGIPRSAVAGAIYRREMHVIATENRIRPLLADPVLGTHAVFDLGIDDKMSITISQADISGLRVVGFHEDNNYAVEHYCEWLTDNGWKNSVIWLPHDGNARSVQTGLTTKQTVEKLGWQVETVPDIGVEPGIKMVRTALKNAFFSDSDEVGELIEHLRRYSRNKAGHPKHDDHSHAADSFRYTAVAMSHFKNVSERKRHQKVMAAQFVAEPEQASRQHLHRFILAAVAFLAAVDHRARLSLNDQVEPAPVAHMLRCVSMPEDPAARANPIDHHTPDSRRPREAREVEHEVVRLRKLIPCRPTDRLVLIVSGQLVRLVALDLLLAQPRGDLREAQHDRIGVAERTLRILAQEVVSLPS
ncbi:conserved hypothetical protein [Ricinus communis]|uniref:Uncharacterized protein n=1 Tax=Ricinus communis TaxID=3988 RepID=B9TAS7_RICCO|nr:conserved hypothetical protein [Ricinus communis]